MMKMGKVIFITIKTLMCALMLHQNRMADINNYYVNKKNEKYIFTFT